MPQLLFAAVAAAVFTTTAAFAVAADVAVGDALSGMGAWLYGCMGGGCVFLGGCRPSAFGLKVLAP